MNFSFLRFPVLASLYILASTQLSFSFGPQTIIVEAENFDHTGGWVIDQQSIDQKNIYNNFN